MRAKAAASRRTVDRDGVVEIALPRKGHDAWLWLALAVAVALAGLAVFLLRGRGREARASAPAPAAESAAGELHEMPIVASGAAMNDEPSEKPSAPAVEEPPAAAEEPVPAPSASPAAEGIRAFPRPGTKRIKVGIVVPDDFELPPGYIKHYQSTDKGEGLRPILMFHPDYHPKDDRGRPLPIPADRIVPPEMAPPGLAIERLEVPLDPYADPEH